MKLARLVPSITLAVALCALAAPAQAQPGFKLTPKVTTTPKPTLGGSPGKITIPKITPPTAKAPKTPRIGPTQPPANGSGRGPSGLPERFTAGQELRNKPTGAASAADRFGTGPSGTTTPRGGSGKTGKKKPGAGGGFGPGSQSDAFGSARLGGGNSEGSSTTPSTNGGQASGDGNPIRGSRNARISSGAHVWGAMDFEEAHIVHLGKGETYTTADGRTARIDSGVQGADDWVVVSVYDSASGDSRRYEYVNGTLVEQETTKPSGNQIVVTTDPATGESHTTTICTAPDCSDIRVNPNDIPRGTPPPAAADDGPAPPTRLDTLINYGPDGGLPDIEIDPSTLPDPDGQLINPTRDGSPPRGEGGQGEGTTAGVRSDPLIHWAPGNEPHDDPPPASPGGPSGTKSPVAGDRGGDDGKRAAGKASKGKGAKRQRPSGPGGSRP